MKPKPDTEQNNTNGTHGGSESESESVPTTPLLRPSLSLLTRRHFSACRESLNQIPRSDPNVAVQVDQILAVADVLSAAERRRHPLDWYSILRLPPPPGDNRDLTRQHFKTLVRLLDPNKNKLPFADEALMRVREAWCVLSDPSSKARFDREVEEHATKTASSPSSFWTMCPYCWYLHEYDRRYEDCTMRCVNCQRTFHGAPVRPPPPEAVVAGRDEYYCYHVSLPLRYPVGGERCRFGDGVSGARKRIRVKTVANRIKIKGKGFVRDSDFDGEENNGVR